MKPMSPRGIHMLRKLRNEEEGFTLIELLVVILIIGILAAIALPSFLGQKNKGYDASAKSNARNAVSQLESYYVDAETYVGYTNAMLSTAGLPGGTSSGQVDVGTPAVDGYTITARSKSGCDFLITKTAGGPPTRSTSGGSCSSSTW